jgi:hypothetical protein
MDDYGDRQGLWVGLTVGAIAIGLLVALLITAVNLAECERRGDLIRLCNSRGGPRYSEVYPTEWAAWVADCRD